MRLEGKTAVVCGVGGIGAAVALAYADEGAKVWCLDIDGGRVDDVVASITTNGGLADGATCDSTDPIELERQLTIGSDWLGQLDIFMTTVGGGARPVPFLELSTELWDELIQRNLTAPFLGAQIAGRIMAGQHSGSIILTSSQLGQVALPGYAPYCAAKGGINQLVKVIACDLATHGVRANALAPGPTWTAEAEREVTSGGVNQEVVAQATSLIPMGRWATPAEIARAAVFLASDEASFVTGTTLVVDGGYTAL